MKFGLSSSKNMDLAIRRYSYKFVPPKIDLSNTFQIE